MATTVPIPKMIEQVRETLKPHPEEYNVNGIVREIIDGWGQRDICEVQDGWPREYWQIVQIHSMAEPVAKST